MKKRIISLLLVSAFVVSMVAGCGGSNTADGNEGTEETADEQTTETTDEEKVIRVATPGNYVPFTIYDEATKEWSGFEIELWTIIGEKSGYEIEWVQIDTPAAFAELDLERVDTIAKQITLTEERKEVYNFSRPFFYGPDCLVVAEDNTEITCWDDMEGKTIALKDGSSDYEVVKANDPEGKVNIALYEDDASQLRDVSLGRADASVYPILILKYLLEEQPDLKLKGVGMDDPLYLEVNAYPFTKTERGDKIRELTDSILNEMIEDGSYAELSEKWFGIDVMSADYAKEYEAENLN